MKSLHLHLAGTVLSVTCVAALASGLYQQRQTTLLNSAINQPGSTVPGEDPRITLARGLLLVRAGDDVGAQGMLQTALQNSDGALQNQVRYNLGNLALRDAMKRGLTDDKRAPMLALAKQQYRDALLREPGNLAARYNLERALWLAPEEGMEQPGRDENNAEAYEQSRGNQDNSDQKERATTTMKNEGGGLP